MKAEQMFGLMRAGFTPQQIIALEGTMAQPAPITPSSPIAQPTPSPQPQNQQDLVLQRMYQLVNAQTANLDIPPSQPTQDVWGDYFAQQIAGMQATPSAPIATLPTTGQGV